MGEDMKKLAENIKAIKKIMQGGKTDGKEQSGSSIKPTGGKGK
jgi:hypothetical protein